jgi:hypothetical protein
MNVLFCLRTEQAFMTIAFISIVINVYHSGRKKLSRHTRLLPSSTCKLLININLREALLTLSALTNAAFLLSWGFFRKLGFFTDFL